MSPSPSSSPPSRKSQKNPVRKTHKCPVCAKMFSTREGLDRHRVATHQSPAPKKTPRGKGRSKMLAGQMLVNTRAGVDFPGKVRDSSSALNLERYLGKRGGGEWAFRALDPCAESSFSTMGCKIPDMTSMSTVALNVRADTMISAPTEASGALWDCLILALPYPELPYVYFTRKSGDDWSFDVTSRDQYITYPAINFGTVQPNGNTNNSFSALTSGPSMGQYGQSFRTTYKGISVLHNSSDLKNEGMVWAGQVGLSPTSNAQDIINTPGGVNTPTGVVFQDNVLGKIPNSVSGLVSVCPDYVRFKAREGIYLPSRFVQEEHKYVVTDWPQIQPGDPPSLTHFTHPLALGFVAGDGSPTGTPHRVKADSGKWVVTSGFDNTQLGIIFFEGLDFEATLDLKVRAGIEAVAAPASPWYPFSTRAPMSDKDAIEEFFIVQNQLSPAYPESYNSFGMLIPVIGKAVADLAGWGISRVTNWLKGRYDAQESVASRV